MTTPKPLDVHMVGSIPLADAEAVFRTVSASVGSYLKRLPDGEPGARRRWVGMLGEILDRHPLLEPDQDEAPFAMKFADGRVFRERRRLRIRPGIEPAAIRFETGYAAMAIDSFVIFDRLQQDGAIPPDIKFQIAIPSPVAAAYNYIARRHRDVLLELFTNHLIEEVHQIAMALPQERIAIQWDVLHEVLVWEGYFPDRPDHYKNQIATVLGRLGEAVPQPLELGYHLCYGSPENEHLMLPRDAGVMVEIMRETIKHVRRPITYFHFPVPRARTDIDFYRPLAALSMPKGTELYVGLLHVDDHEGNRKRLALARQFIPVTGIASECGWGRCDAGSVDALLATTRSMVA